MASAAENSPTGVTMEEIVALCKRRGFVFPSSEIYGGLGSTYDYRAHRALLEGKRPGGVGGPVAIWRSSPPPSSSASASARSAGGRIPCVRTSGQKAAPRAPSCA